MKMETYCGKFRLGYLGDFTAEWWTEEDWKKHKEYVEELKASGEYGKEVEHCISFVHNPLLDEPNTKGGMTHRFIILDI